MFKFVVILALLAVATAVSVKQAKDVQRARRSGLYDIGYGYGQGVYDGAYDSGYVSDLGYSTLGSNYYPNGYGTRSLYNLGYTGYYNGLETGYYGNGHYGNEYSGNGYYGNQYYGNGGHGVYRSFLY